MTKSVTGNQSVEKAFTLLQAFTDARPQLRVTELAQLTDLGQSTVSRLLATLEAIGYVIRDPESGRYRVGNEVIRLAGLALNQSPVHRAARQIAQDLAHATGLGANVGERSEATAVRLLHFEGQHVPRSQTLLGKPTPLHATGLGKSLICELPPEEVEALLSQGLQRFTPRTVTDLAVLHAELADIRQTGFAKEVEELAFGRGCVAAPVRDHTGHIVAALSLAGPLSVLRLGEREGELASTVIEAADSISVELGYHSLAATEVLARP